MFRYFIFLLLLHLPLEGSELVNFLEPSKNENVTFFLSTPKSGTNVITGSLSAITRKPISWFYWDKTTLDPSSDLRNHPSYNRLGLPLVSHKPLLYRTHYEFDALRQVPSQKNKLIFLARNPKELLYRKFFLEKTTAENPDAQFIEEFLDKYLMAFSLFDSWCPKTRLLVFYEDYIVQEVPTLRHLLGFMQEEPLFFDDFLANKHAYTLQLLQSYANQHKHNNGCASSKDGPKAIFYTKTASADTLQYIDTYIQYYAPDLWEKYLKRFQTSIDP